MKSGDYAGAVHVIEDSYAYLYANWDGGYTPLHIPSPSHISNDTVYRSDAEHAAADYLSDWLHGGGAYGSPESYLAPPPNGCN